MADMSRSINLTIDPLFSRVMKTQRDIQTMHMGGDPAEMTPELKRTFIRSMTLALMAEAVEALDETQWKPWARIDNNKPIVDRDKFRGELADVFIFLMNLMLVGDITSTELLAAVEAKQRINIQRQLDGYTNGNKCPICGRAYDDPAVTCRPGRRQSDSDKSIVDYPAYCANGELA
jgi:NTP pyrophosphatase (non-canonical NTP hydrolase)